MMQVNISHAFPETFLPYFICAPRTTYLWRYSRVVSVSPSSWPSCTTRTIGWLEFLRSVQSRLHLGTAITGTVMGCTLLVLHHRALIGVMPQHILVLHHQALPGVMPPLIPLLNELLVLTLRLRVLHGMMLARMLVILRPQALPGMVTLVALLMNLFMSPPEVIPGMILFRPVQVLLHQALPGMMILLGQLLLGTKMLLPVHPMYLKLTTKHEMITQNRVVSVVTVIGWGDHVQMKNKDSILAVRG